MKKIAFAVLFMVSLAAHAQSPQVPCAAANHNASWFDTVNNVQYLCTTAGWKANVGIGAPTVGCSAANYGAPYTDITGSSYQCGSGGWFQAAGGGGASTPATNALLKGNGTANGVVAGVPGTDYNSPLAGVFNASNYPSSCTVNAVAYTTQADCAFYTAALYATTNSTQTTLILGSGAINTQASFVEPGGLYSVNVVGCGIFCTHLIYSGGSAIPVISRATGGNYTFLQVRDMTIDGNGVASAILDAFALNQSVFQNINAVNIATGKDHFIKFGSFGGDAFQVHASNINLFPPSAYNSPAQFANVTCAPSGGSVSTCTVVNGGSGYPGTTGLTVTFTGTQNGASYQPCSGTQPVGTATLSGGVVTAVTVTTTGTTCVGPVYAQVTNQFPVNYGIVWNASDSTGDDLITYAGQTAGIEIVGGDSVFHHLHPALIPTGIQINGGNSTIEGAELDSIFLHGFDFEEPFTNQGTSVYGTNAYFGTRVMNGAATYYFGAGAGNVVFGPQGSLTTGTKPTGWAEFVTQSGTIDSGTAAWPTNTTMLGNDNVAGTVGDYSPKLGAKIINGVGYSNNYTGASLDVRVNACISDAETKANGNTSGICDSSGDGGTQSILAPIIVGDSSLHPVTWKLPGNFQWTASGFPSNSTSAIITEHANTSIIGPCTNFGQCTIFDTNAFIGAMYKTVEATGYYRVEGFQLYNGGYTMALGGTMVVNGTYDTSTFANIGILSQTASTAALLIQNPTGVTCCATTFDRIQANSNNQGGVVLDIEGSSAGEPQAINFTNSTFTHPASGLPVIKCNDTATLKASSVNFFGTYLETNSTDTTTALIQNTGCGQLLFHGLTAVDPSTSSTATLLTSSNAFATSLTVEGLKMYAGFAQPATAIVNNSTGETITTDAYGQVSSYHSNKNSFTSIKANVYTVATLPSASTLGAGTTVTVSDCTTYTPGALCTGGGSDYMIAVSNGTSWTVH